MVMTPFTRYLILFYGAALLGCVAGTPPEAELRLARTTLLAAENAGAPDLSPKPYLEAQSSLAKAESLIAERAFDQARARLEQATRLAQSACDEATTQKGRQHVASRANPEGAQSSAAFNKLPAKEASLPSLLTTYTVQSGDNLWSIAARTEVYGDALLWPLLYQGNRDQIKDPRQIYTGQTLTIQRNLSDIELEETRCKARSSDIFPIEQMPRNPL